MMHYTNIVLCVFFCVFFLPNNKKIIFFLFFFFCLFSSNNSLSSRLVSSRQKYLSHQSRPFCCIHQKKRVYIHNTLHYYTMGGVLSVPGGGGSGPAVEDVVALAESNDVPYAIPLPVNEVRGRRRLLLLLLRRRLFLIVPNVVIKYLIIPMSQTIPTTLLRRQKQRRQTEQHESVLRLETVSRPHVRTTGPRRHRAEGRRVPENGGEFQTVVHGREGIRIRRESISSSHTEFYVPRRRFYER